MHLAINCLQLAEAPDSPLALHTVELSQALLADERVERLSWIAPTRLQVKAPSGVEPVESLSGPGSLGRLRFDQRYVVQRADAVGADVLLSLQRHAPLRSPLPVVVGPARPPAAPRAGIVERLRRAAGAAGASGAAAIFGWRDMPPGSNSPRQKPIQPWVGPALRPTGASDDQGARDELDVPGDYVLVHGVDPVDVEALLAAWSWVEASIGDAYALVIAGLETAARRTVARASAEMGLAASVKPLESLGWHHLPAVYRGASAFLHLGYTADGQELRWALATGTPIAGVATSVSSAIVGEAGYLVDGGQARALGAACLTLLVERDGMGRRLGEDSMMRASGYHRPDAVVSLIDLLASVLD
jgi:glycosyltransferase involved in cell wall biosynthesis